MAIFGSKNNTKKETAVKKTVVNIVRSAGLDLYDSLGLIRKPRVTEKATMLAEKNVYAFEISPEATKSGVAKAIRELYKVTPIKVNIVKLPRKQVMIRGKKGFKTGVTKAYIHLKEGDKIEFV